MKKRMVSLLLCASLLLSLLGCAAASASSADLMEGVTPRTGEQRAPTTGESAALARFGLELFLSAPGGEENPLISPLSVITALAMTANGARGETLAEMEEALGLNIEELNAVLGKVTAGLPQKKTCSVSLANAIWFKDTSSFQVEQDFLQTNADYYGAGIYKAPFDGRTLKEINGWMEDHTGGMIRNILDEIPAEAVMYLVNALAFDGEWSVIYNERQVRERVFTTANGEERSVDMMFSEEHGYLETDTATGFIKNYQGGRYAFAALLPREGITPEQCAASLTGEELVALLTNPGRVSVDVGLPKFKIEYAADLSAALKGMGVERAFAGGDFTGMGSSEEGPLAISRVMHKTFIAVDEKGTKAGAATAVEMAPTAAPPVEDPKVVILDRPFLYFIFDTATGLPLFIGTVTDPG